MVEHQLGRHLDRVGRRLQRIRIWKRLAACWLLAAVVAAAVAFFDLSLGLPAIVAVPLAALAGSVAVVIRERWRGIDRLEVARAVERSYPELEQRLVTAVEQKPEQSVGRLGYLQYQVIREATEHGRRHEWVEAAPTGRMFRARALHWASLALLVAALVMLFRETAVDPAPVGPASMASPAVVGRSTSIEVEPGDVELERGSSLLVLARFPEAVPAAVTLVTRDASTESRRLSLARSLNDPLFGGRLPQVDRDLFYRVEYDNQQTREYRVTVFEYPELERADAVIEYPSFTGLPESRMEDVRLVSAVEGSTFTFLFTVNKPLATGRLIDAEGEEYPLAPDPDLENVYRVALKPEQNQRLRLELTDAQDRQNREPPEFRITVVANRPPDIKIVFPSRDLPVSPLEELALEANVRDDFGLRRVGLAYTVADQAEQEVTLLEEGAGDQMHPVQHLLALESLEVEPDQLVSYYFFADDAGPDGETRRTFGDMFFAEVRHFEEIFRQGEQPPGGESQQQQQQQQGGQQAQQIEKLAELQKQVVNATWTLIRQVKPEAQALARDVEVVRESQQQALTQAQELREKITDPQSQVYADSALKFMETALAQLGEGTLDPALSAERSAYQALLKLRAREHEVVRGQQQGGGGGGGGSSRSQQQLNELELDSKENRYESQRNAAQQQSQESSGEQLQALNRLRELARRQEDLNEKLKELEHALREAQSEAERQEIERQLKRLRDEQQQMLRDTDELRDRMQNSQNPTETADARRQLDQTRERLQEASEALQEGQLSQALNAGTRAQRELQEMRDEFRRKTAGQFTEAMRQMQQDAQELAQTQEQLAEQMKELDQQTRRTLGGGRERQALEDAFEEQKQRLSGVLDQAKEVVEQAESTEPLLAKELYDTIRNARQDEPEKALDLTTRLLSSGLLEQAAITEQQARRGVDNIRDGIDKAAESVLGDELDSLKRAQSQLDQLTRSLENELAAADPSRQPRPGQEDARGQQPGGQQPGGQQPGEQQPGEQQPGEQQPGEQQPGEQQPGEQQPGEQQPGEQQPGEQQPGEQQPGEQQPGGQQPGGQQPGGQQPGGQQPGGQQPGGQQPGGQQPGGQQPGGQQPGGQQPGGQQPGGQQPGGQQPGGQQPGGQQPGGQQPGGQQPGGQQPGGQQPGGQQPGGQQPGGQQPGGQQPGGQQPGGQQPGGQQPGGQQPGGQQPGGRRQPGLRGPQDGPRQDSPSGTATAGGGGFSGPGNPLTGEGFVEWSDGLREVEEMLSDPEARAEAAAIRERARSMRAEFKRHSEMPNWDLVELTVLDPLMELRQRLAEEIALREHSDALVPIDRDPVPADYRELVREYYERLGSGR